MNEKRENSTHKIKCRPQDPRKRQFYQKMLNYWVEKPFFAAKSNYKVLNEYALPDTSI